MTNKDKALAAVIMGAIIGGAVPAVTKIGLFSLPPLSFAFIRFLIATVCLLPFLFHSKKSIRNLTKLFPVSLLATANIIFFIVGIKTTTATIGQLLYAAVPFMTGAIMYLLYKEKLSSRKLISIIIGFIGVVIVIFLPLLEKSGLYAGDLKGNLLIGIGVINWSFYMVLSGRQHNRYTPFDLTAAFILVTTLVLLPLAAVESVMQVGWWNAITVAGVFAIFFVAVFGTVISYLLNQYAIRHGGSVFASMLFYLLPILAFISAAFLLGERLTTGLVIGAILVLISVFLASRQARTV